MTEIKKGALSKELKQILRNVNAGGGYRKMLKHREAGHPICVAAALVPSELLFAMDVFPVYPESLAAITAGSGQTGAYFEQAQDHGFSNTVCSYTRCGLGISWLDKSPLGPIPEPDLFITDVTVCCLHVNWWTYLEDHFKKPTFRMDIPANDDPDDPAIIDYYEQQLRMLVPFIEEHTGNKLDMDRLKEVVGYSDQAGYYWKKILDLRRHKPSPVSFRHMAGQILPLVTLLGDPESAECYKEFYRHYQNLIDLGETPAAGGEKYRLVWDGIPIWHNLQVINYFEEKGANFVWEPYTALGWGNKTRTGRLDIENPFRSLAEKYTNIFHNRPIEDRYKVYDQAIRDYDIDGLVMFANRSCRPESVGQYETVELVKKHHGLPSLIFEGDQADPAGFDWEDARNQIDGFIEILESR